MANKKIQDITYHLLPASTKNYEDNCFTELVEEERKYGNKNYWHIGNKHVSRIKKGDICLFYYSDLPDKSSRILFVGEVRNSDYGSDSKISICPDGEEGMKYIEVKLKAISLEDPSIFSLDNLRNKYNLIKGEGRVTHTILNKSKHNDLINDINYYAKNRIHYLSSVNKYFNENFRGCFFGCKTFIQENGNYYIEDHHLVEQNLKSKNQHNPNIIKLINNPNNIFKLCPMCHMKIHHAKIDVRKKMITDLYNDNKEFFDDNFNELKDGQNTLEWLCSLYK